MNGEIKFRVWDIKFEKWMNNVWVNYGLVQGFDEWYNKRYLKIQQYTGLLDQNGKEIYDGDILKLIDKSIGSVKYDISYAGYIFDGKLKSEKEIDLETASLSYVRPEESVIIGNIFENPELL